MSNNVRSLLERCISNSPRMLPEQSVKHPRCHGVTFAAGEETRRLAVAAVDPVRTVKLSAFVKGRMQAAHALHGAALEAAAARLPASVSDVLQRMMK